MNSLTTARTEIASASLLKDLTDLLSLTVDEAPKENIERLTQRLMDAGGKILLADMYKSIMAEQIYLMKAEEDWKFILDPETRKPYSCWDEFHERLVSVLPLSESSSWFYQKVVRYGYEVLGLKKGEFAMVGGLTTVGKMLELTIVNGYDRGDWGLTVKPATVQFKEWLDLRYPAPTVKEQLQKFFFSSTLRHDYLDASAINAPARELNEMVNDLLGKPRVWWETEDAHLIWHIVYPNGERQRGKLTPDTPMPVAVMMALEKGLKVSG